MSDLTYELRAARPVAPESLRERVAEIAGRETEPRHTWSFPRLRVRRAALVLVPACLALAVLGAVGAALLESPGGEDHAAVREEGAVSPTTAELAPMTRKPVPKSAQAPLRSVLTNSADRAKAQPPLTQLPPARQRYQDYSASMRIRLDDVDELSGATQQAMRTARRLGGYVVSVQYGSEGAKKGEAYLTLRVPVERVQTAIVRLSNLGTILSQNVNIQDLQPTVTALERSIVRLRSDIAAVDARLRSPGISEAEKARLEFRRERLSSQLTQAVRNRQATINRASFATVSLNLTTHKREEQAAPPGQFRDTLNDVGGILAAEAAWTLLVLAVAAPFVVLLVLAIWGIRSARRLTDRRLLESS
jgi:Domain of unknown function (DUF4349)